ncbi:DUF6404 family protein [Lysobacter sp. A289]
MDNDNKLHRALESMNSVAVSSSTKTPLLHQAAWRLGIMVPPPLLASFGFNFVFLGGTFAALWGTLMFIFFTFVNAQDSALSVAILAIGSASAGVLFGLIMALYFRSLAIRNNLPTWRSLMAVEN